VTKTVSQPEFSKDLSGYNLYWEDSGVTVRMERVSDDGKGEMVVTQINGGSTTEFLRTGINLLSSSTMSQVGKRLERNLEIDWDTILTYVTRLVVADLRDGGLSENINQEPESMRVEYLLAPILPLNEPTTVYTAGGKGKSILADYIAVLVQCGVAALGNLPFAPTQANVLYLDWEADAETHRRYITAIKRGLGLNDDNRIEYRRLEHPLSQVIKNVYPVIAQNGIGLVIIDSQMAATASGTRGLTEAQVASEYYNLIRSFGCTTLTIDHITKVDMRSDSGSEAPYGSVVKYNRSRSQFELRLPDDEDNSDHKEFALVHRKFNLGRKQPPLGIAVDFTNNDDELIRINFSRCDVTNNPRLVKTLPAWEQVRNAIFDGGGQLTIKEITEFTGLQSNTVRLELNRHGKLFTIVDKKGKQKVWDVLSNVSI